MAFWWNSCIRHLFSFTSPISIIMWHLFSLQCYHMTWYEKNHWSQLEYRDTYFPCGVRKHFQLKVTPYLILSNMLFIKCELDLSVKLAFVIYYMPMRFEREAGVLTIIISRCRMISTKNMKYKTSNCHKSVQRHMDPTLTLFYRGKESIFDRSVLRLFFCIAHWRSLSFKCLFPLWHCFIDEKNPNLIAQCCAFSFVSRIE
jgi:hypothetical protein